MGPQATRPRRLMPWYWAAIGAVGMLVLGIGSALVKPSLLGFGSGREASTTPRPTLGAGTSPTPATSFAGTSQTLPLRAAFYEAGYPQAWSLPSGPAPLAFTPAAGRYDENSAAVVDRQITDLQYAGLQAGIVAWTGRGTPADQRLPLLLQRAVPARFHWAVSYEPEAAGNPSTADITADLTHLATVTANPGYLHISGRAVLFVRTSATDSCAALDRWAKADLGGFHLIVQNVSGSASCTNQPQNWYGYNPAAARTVQPGQSVTVSPGYAIGSKHGLTRDPDRFRADVTALATSKAPLQLITSYNDWIHGTAIEAAPQWTSRSGRGIYLDLLHDVLVLHRTGQTSNPTATGETVTVAAVGDMACDPDDRNWNGGAGNSHGCHGRAVAALLGRLHPNAFLALGDTQYESGTASQFEKSYNRTFGRYLSITHPVSGNHEYRTKDASGYFDYFGSRAGARGKGYYSFDLGAWHLIALNSECDEVSCSKGSAQEAWLRQDLAAHTGQCVLAYWHVPRWSNGAEHGDSTSVGAFVEDLYAAKAEIILNGHDHGYERFAPRAPSGAVDQAGGIREFVVGTGGKNLKPVSPSSATEAHNDDTYGMLSLTLSPGSYSWRFVSEAGGSYHDAGTGTCH